jgi:hypothetical protein
MEMIIWIDHVRTKGVLQRDKEDRNIVHTTKRRNAKSFGHFLHRICLLKHVTKGKIEGRIKVAGTRGGRYEHLLDA